MRDGVAEPFGDVSGPVGELGSRPLEAMVGMTKLPGGKRFPHLVVLAIRRRQHDRVGASELEQCPLEGAQSRRVEMLDDLDDDGRVEPGEPLVAIEKRAVQELHAVVESLPPEPFAGDFERADRDVDADDLGELPIPREIAEHLAVAAAEVENAFRPRRLHSRQHGSAPLIVEPNRHLTGFGRLGSFGWLLVGRGRLFLDEPLDRLADEARLMSQEAACDRLLERMLREPAFPLRDQLLDLAVADPVMLRVVEDRDQDVEMREELGERRRLPQRHREVRALAPLRMPIVERQSSRVDVVAERSEDVGEKPLAAAHRQSIKSGLERNRRCRQLGPILRAAVHRRAEDLGDGHAEERRRDIGTVVDVLIERPLSPLAGAANQSDRIDFEHQARGAAFGRRFRIEDVRLAEGQVERLESIGMLLQQVAEVGRRGMRRRQREQHGRPSGSSRTWDNASSTKVRCKPNRVQREDQASFVRVSGRSGRIRPGCRTGGGLCAHQWR